MKCYQRIEVAGAALVFMEKSRNKFCAGIVNPNKSVQEIEELYLMGRRINGIYMNGDIREIQKAEFVSFKKARAMFDSMYDALASGKTKIAVH